MGSKTISLNDEAYDRLKAAKGTDESFSDVVLRLTKGEKDVLAGFGAWKGTEAADRAREAGEHLNRSLEERLKETTERRE